MHETAQARADPPSALPGPVRGGHPTAPGWHTGAGSSPPTAAGDPVISDFRRGLNGRLVAEWVGGGYRRIGAAR